MKHRAIDNHDINVLIKRMETVLDMIRQRLANLELQHEQLASKVDSMEDTLEVLSSETIDSYNRSSPIFDLSDDPDYMSKI